MVPLAIMEVRCPPPGRNGGPATMHDHTCPTLQNTHAATRADYGAKLNTRNSTDSLITTILFNVTETGTKIEKLYDNICVWVQ